MYLFAQRLATALVFEKQQAHAWYLVPTLRQMYGIWGGIGLVRHTFKQADVGSDVPDRPTQAWGNPRDLKLPPPGGGLFETHPPTTIATGTAFVQPVLLLLL